MCLFLNLFALFLSFFVSRLVHPFSPSDKPLHLGLECLQATTDLVEHSGRVAADDCKIVLRHKILRLALTMAQVNRFKASYIAMPQYCSWLEPADLPPEENITNVLEALKIHKGGCLVLHVPSYF